MYVAVNIHLVITNVTGKVNGRYVSSVLILYLEPEVLK